MEISRPEHAFEAEVTYSPVEAFQPLPNVSTHSSCCLLPLVTAVAAAVPSAEAAPLEQLVLLFLALSL